MSVEVRLAPHRELADLGELLTFLDENDPRPAREQFNERYQWGGWKPMEGFTLDGTILHYPGDPPFKPWAMISFRNEGILVYPADFVAIIQEDGVTFEVARMD
jgi:hypothetical protein